MTNNRVSWIDVARGIGIILVVYGHTLSADSFRYLIYAFHMPLFFFLSGLVFSYKPDQSFISILKKNTKGILYPYLLFAFLSFALWLLIKHPVPGEVLKQFLSIFYGNGNNNLLAFNNLLWFLPCLFIVRLGFYVMLRGKEKQEKSIVPILFFLSIIGYGISLFLPQLKLPFGIETALTAIVFFGIGFWYMHGWKEGQAILAKHLWILLVGCAVVCILFAVLSYQVYGLQIDLRQNRLNNYLYFYLSAFAGIFGTVVVSMLIKKQSVLEYLGRQSLVIFAWHLLAFPYVSTFLVLTHLRELLSQAPVFVSPLVYTFFSILIVLAIAVPLQLGIKKVSQMRQQSTRK
jgi:acyltransferase